VTSQSVLSARPLIAASQIVAGGILVAFVTVFALSNFRTVLIALTFIGIMLALPTFVVSDKRAYWLFLLVLSLPADILKRTTTWIVDWTVLLRQYGLPPMETVSLDIYATDLVLFVLVVLWFARLCVRQDRLYFPKIGYIAIVYFLYTLIDSFRAVSFYLSIFEWCREVLYFLCFVYLANNIVTRSQLRAVVLALLVGLAIESGTVIALFRLDIGTETPLFAQLYKQDPGKLNAAEGPGHTHYAGQSGSEAHVKRSAGTFGHPVLAAYYIEFILPIVMGCLAMARRRRDRVLLGGLLAQGWVALYLTFSRSGLLGCMVGILVFLAVGRWSGLISRRVFAWSAFFIWIGTVVSAPLVIDALWYRPESAYFRLELIETGLHAFWQRPIFGAGLNNGTAVLEDAVRLADGGREVVFTKLHNHYLVVLVEDGLIGFLLFFGFFAQIAVAAFRTMRTAETEKKLVLVGIVAALASIAIHNFGDPFQSHVNSAMLWLYAGIVMAIDRQAVAAHAPPEIAGEPQSAPL
jgi:O-Antigen ligase